MGKMFTYNGKRMVTWNFFTGCEFFCTYCWARRLVTGRLRHIFLDGFSPGTHRTRDSRIFRPGDFVFVCSMGDISFAPEFVWDITINHVLRFPETKFLLCTKAPGVFRRHLRPGDRYPDNVYLATTIETNRHTGLYSLAPQPVERYESLRKIRHRHKMLSLEPLMDFDLDTLLLWVAALKPEIVEVGADNYHNDLPEPEPAKVKALLAGLRQICPTVVEKDGLERLKE